MLSIKAFIYSNSISLILQENADDLDGLIQPSNSHISTRFVATYGELDTLVIKHYLASKKASTSKLVPASSASAVAGNKRSNPDS